MVFFDGEETATSNWADLAFADFFDFPGGANLPANYLVDVWSWGAGTSNPVFIADDWVITSEGKKPDFGKAPYLSNYVLPDSIPLYMYYLDPNYKSALNLNTDLFPFWDYDAVGYSTRNWFINRAVYIAGYVTTIPNGSRADVYAAASFDTPSKWTLEMKRARNTGNGDDVQF